MKKNKNNSYILAFYHSGIFLPFIFFSIISFINNAIFLQKNFVDYNWRYFLAFFSGLNHDLFIFSLIALILSLIYEYLPQIFAPFFITAKDGGMQASDRMSASRKEGSLPKADRGIFKLFSLVILHILICLPILDYLYFKATLERFNWIVLNFINYHSAKGYLGNMGNGYIILVLFFVFLILSIYFSNKKEKIIEPYFFKPFEAICIFLLFSSFFTNSISFKLETNFTGHIKVVEGKNSILKHLSSGSLISFIPKNYITKTNTQFIPFTDKEKTFLEKYGLIPNKSYKLVDAPPHSGGLVIKETKGAAFHSNAVKEKEINDNHHKFTKVIMIVLESFALEYIHATNNDIPVEASPYLDYLINNFPHSKNFYTSDFPSLQGFNVLLSSKIPFIEQNHTKQSYNLANLFEKKYPNSTWFLRGSSRVYGNEEIAIINVFGFSNLIGYEDLAKKYPEPKGYSWGYEDRILYEEAFNILYNNKKRTNFMVIKLLDQHQPIFSYVINAKNQPNSVKIHNSDIVKSIYDADKLLKDFINKCETNNIIDEKTLVIITSDHYPPLGYGHTELIKSDNHSQLGKLPLIFYSKQNDIFEKLDSEKLCCQLDVVPTLCYLLGLDCPKEYMGQNMLSPDYKPRSIGILNNETIYFQSEELSFSESLSNPATSTPAIRKWINNLLAN